MPDVFNSAEDFEQWFGGPLAGIKAGGGEGSSSSSSSSEQSLLSQEEYLLVTNRLHQVLRPFMMRRLKESVAAELPQKVREAAGKLLAGCLSCEPSTC
jgi:SNF2 family DNA or RNA helicase